MLVPQFPLTEYSRDEEVKFRTDFARQIEAWVRRELDGVQKKAADDDDDDGEPRGFNDIMVVVPGREASKLRPGGDFPSAFSVTPGRSARGEVIGGEWADTMSVTPGRVADKVLHGGSFADTMVVAPGRSAGHDGKRFLSAMAVLPGREASKTTLGGSFPSSMSVSPGRTASKRSDHNEFADSFSVEPGRTAGTVGPPQGPVWTTIPDQSKKVTSSTQDFTLNVAPYVSDPNHRDDQLTLSVSRSNTSVISGVAVRGTTIFLILRARDAGQSTVTVTARDPDGNEASTSFLFVLAAETVQRPNVPTLTARKNGSFGASLTVAVPGGGGPWTLIRYQRSTSSSFSGTPDEMTGGQNVGGVTYSNLSVGTHYFRARTEGSGGNSAWSAVQSVVITNTVPSWSSIPNQAARVGAADTRISLGPYVSDQEHSDSQLTFSARSSNTSVVQVSISGSTLVIDWRSTTGSATVTVTATDPLNLSASRTFTCTLSAAVTPGQAPGRAGINTSVSGNVVTVTATAPTTGGTPTSYRFEESNVSSAFSSGLYIKTRSSAGSVTFTITESGTYYYRVRASNSHGNGPWSVVDSRTVTISVTPTQKSQSFSVPFNVRSGFIVSTIPTASRALINSAAHTGSSNLYMKTISLYRSPVELLFDTALNRTTDTSSRVDLVSSWENGDTSIRIDIRGRAIDLPGPNNADWNRRRDSTSSYDAETSSTSTLGRNMVAFIDGVHADNGDSSQNGTLIIYWTE